MARRIRLSFALLFVFTSLGVTRQAFASGDMGCSPVWRLLHRNYEGCSNMAFLSPSNDTRVNLLLLLADLRGLTAKSAASVSTTEAPLFGWEALVETYGSQADKDALKNYGSGYGDKPPCKPVLPADDPFSIALQADHALKTEERDALLAARKLVQNGCPADTAIAAAQNVAQTASAKAFTAYLEGAAAFWKPDYDKATAIFSSLTNAQPAWVRETAIYMVGRSLINRPLVGAFDEYGSFKKGWRADDNTILAAEAALDKYLQLYPKGVYAQSARGLKRRGYWLSKDAVKLSSEYGALLMDASVQRNISDVDLVQEIDNKIASPPADYGSSNDNEMFHAVMKSAQNPLLLAMLDLLDMRMPENARQGAENGVSTLSLADLQRQKPYFASQMPLYEYLLAVHAFYVENKPAEVLRLLPDAARQGSFSYLQFSRQMLRGMALEAMKDRNALGFWMQMLPGAQAAYQRPALELAIAYHQERAGQVRAVFAADSPVRYPYMRYVLLANVADADLLRTQATNTHVPQRERDIALFTLLYKEATRGDSAQFLKDVALVPANASTTGYYQLNDISYEYVPPGQVAVPSPIPVGIFLHGKTSPTFSCPGLPATEQQLVQDANNPTAQLCVADFVRLNDAVTYLGSVKIPTDELGGTIPQFPGGNFVRMDTYKTVLANAKSSKDDKAYALFRAVNCYAPSGNNDCGGSDVPKTQRKAWFTTLKRDYADTRWAKELQYYW
ncbi:MAG: hypothetical protein V4734_00185 [Terriglobus sp.]